MGLGPIKIMLFEHGAQARPPARVNPIHDFSWKSVLYFQPDDLDALFQHLTRLGLSPTTPEVTYYGMREFTVQGLDGHLLSFGEDLLDEDE